MESEIKVTEKEDQLFFNYGKFEKTVWNAF